MPDIGPMPDPERADQPLEPAHDPYAVLRNRDLVLYLVGRFVASLGQQMLTVAIGWELYERTHKPLNLGLVGLTQMLPMILFTLPAGHIADNHDRKKIIIAMTFVIGCASGALAFISHYQFPVGWIYASLFAAGVARTFVWPASSAFMPQLVPRQDFSKAVTWSSGSFQLSSVAGPAASRALIALTGKAVWVYLLNMAAALVCLAMISLVRSRRVTAAREEMTLANLIARVEFVFASRIIL